MGKYVDGLGNAVTAESLEHSLSRSSGIVDFTEDAPLMSTWMQKHTLAELLGSARTARATHSWK